MFVATVKDFSLMLIINLCILLLLLSKHNLFTLIFRPAVNEKLYSVILEVCFCNSSRMSKKYVILPLSNGSIICNTNRTGISDIWSLAYK